MGGRNNRLERASEAIARAKRWEQLHAIVDAADHYYQQGELTREQAEALARDCWARAQAVAPRLKRPRPKDLHRAEYRVLKGAGYRWSERDGYWIAPDTEAARALYELHQEEEGWRA